MSRMAWIYISILAGETAAAEIAPEVMHLYAGYCPCTRILASHLLLLSYSNHIDLSVARYKHKIGWINNSNLNEYAYIGVSIEKVRSENVKWSLNKKNYRKPCELKIIINTYICLLNTTHTTPQTWKNKFSVDSLLARSCSLFCFSFGGIFYIFQINSFAPQLSHKINFDKYKPTAAKRRKTLA